MLKKYHMKSVGEGCIKKSNFGELTSCFSRTLKKSTEETLFLMQRSDVFTKLPNVFDGKIVNPLMHNVPKWSDTLQKSWSKCFKIFKVCLTILEHYALKG